MQLAVTIHEKTPEITIDVIRALDADYDAIEVRADTFGQNPVDWNAIRAATAKPIIATNRGGGHVDIDAALAAGIDLVDVEWPGEFADTDRVVLSHHDYDGMPDIDELLRRMQARHVKIAATPHNFADNARLLAALGKHGTTIIGMGARGLYSRILAPFFGSEFQFVSVDETRSAAPGQLTLQQALAIYGSNREALGADTIFAIVGNPASHSASPAIHNAIFRERGIAAAYSIYETDDFLDIAAPFARGERFAPDGLSITAPFKEEAMTFAESIDADIRANAREAGAVNTLVRIGGRIVADNTDVDGFEALIKMTDARTAAVIGAGGTARAALVALRRAGIETTVFNRTASKLDARPLDQLRAFRGDLVINTLPRNVAVALPIAGTIIEAAYGGESHATFNGLNLLRAQAVRQSELFLEACK
ncbi:MAG TPA: type I 3-dehydroquinate dehydratase [Thermoanaerobaculia bacterium]|jgi:3-dehydroquinate dehydratase/shikimate dehydrogenase|nr:type I 3-dehydroquinate dehydratase [Thermoanaerobaculia bacterium]